MTNEITKPNKPPIGGLFKKGIAANRNEYEQKMRNIDPKAVPNRLGLILDDSGSMGTTGMQDAHTAVKNFTASCNMMDTSIAVYPINVAKKPLTCDYDLVNVYVSTIRATDGTELYTTLRQLIETEPITRAVAFSDGGPTDSALLEHYSGWGGPNDLAKKVVEQYREKKICVDTIFIGEAGSPGYKEMEELAKQTGGIFIHFKDSLSLSTGLKYLTPGFRGLLANAEIKEKIQRGESV